MARNHSYLMVHYTVSVTVCLVYKKAGDEEIIGALKRVKKNDNLHGNHEFFTRLRKQQLFDWRLYREISWRCVSLQATEVNISQRFKSMINFELLLMNFILIIL